MFCILAHRLKDLQSMVPIPQRPVFGTHIQFRRQPIHYSHHLRRYIVPAMEVVLYTSTIVQKRRSHSQVLKWFRILVLDPHLCLHHNHCRCHHKCLQGRAHIYYINSFGPHRFLHRNRYQCNHIFLHQADQHRK